MVLGAAGQSPPQPPAAQTDPSAPSAPAPSSSSSAGTDSGSYSANPPAPAPPAPAPASDSSAQSAQAQPASTPPPAASASPSATPSTSAAPAQSAPQANSQPTPPPPQQPPTPPVQQAAAPRPVPAVPPPQAPSSAAPAPSTSTVSSGTGSAPVESAKDKEDEDVSYVVGILAKPKKQKVGAAPSRDRKRVRMTSKSGVEFSCELPGPADPSDEEQAQQDAVTPETVMDVLKQRLSKGPCFERTVGYWAYKVCPFREVTQFHRESNGALSSVFHLGHYESHSDKAPTSLTPYSQTYTKGTGERNCEVRFVCPTDKDKSSKSKAHETTVASVSEPWALHYEIEVHTQHACLTVKEKDAHKAASSSLSVLSLLNPLKGKCFNHVAGWWTYEFCYMDRVRQYHAELVSPDGKEGSQGSASPSSSSSGSTGSKHVVTAEYILGRMEKGVGNDLLEKNTAINRRTTVEDSFVGQLYTDGTNCDLTNKPREITVQFFCDSKDSGTRVSGVAETATCQYTLNVYTSLLCEHPFFKPKQPKVKTIVCEPVRNVFTGEAM